MKLYCIGIALVFMANTLTLTLACEDITDAFTITLDDGSTLQKTCKQARKNPWGQCEKREVKFACPQTCGQCEGDVQCMIKADLQFPQNEYKMFHSESLQIEKVGETENDVCYSRNTKTEWGCTHIGGNANGDAVLDGRDSMFSKNSVSVRVFDGRKSTLRVGVSHRFAEAEVLQEPDYTGRANLIIKVNGNIQGQSSYRHGKNAIKSTHVGMDMVNDKNKNVGFVNPNYNGDYFVMIECDDQCNCNIAKKETECSLKAQLKFPKISDLSGFGQHFASMDVKHVEKNESCSAENSNTGWCKSYGEAAVINFEDAGFLKYNMAHFVNIPNASNSSFKFDISSSWNVVQDLKALNVPPQLDLYVNNDIVKSVPHDSTSASSLEFRCDSSCNCS